MTSLRLGNSNLDITPIGPGTGAIVGARKASQVDGIGGAMEPRLDDSKIAEIRGGLPASIDMMQLD